ncbi:hypothetical protein OGV43_05510 [Citrobacter sp. Cb003]|uniref:hypothetical protein n=1 Tax=Citrobacter sp. Cb003 TaxID=2985005 RepID=UPI00257B7A46|nr:hypothetical protein [Citrobacter sp. Cb003]MDM3379280.1 hypothetical protein [Citrobacter sp. Cb003]
MKKIYKQQQAVLVAMKAITIAKRQCQEDDSVWLTTREIAEEMDMSLYGMRYILLTMLEAELVTCTQRGKRGLLYWREL